MRPKRPYPHGIDLCIVLPFLMDTLGNTLDLYDSIEFFDDVMHFATWVPWVVAFGLLLHYAPPVPRWAHFGLVLGFGAVTHILWELLEFVTFIRGGAEEATAYRDTLGDLTLSLCGSLVGALLCVTVLWPRGEEGAVVGPRQRSHRRPGGGVCNKRSAPPDKRHPRHPLRRRSLRHACPGHLPTRLQ